MPLYEYECAACGQRFEIIQKFSDPAPDACARCGKGPVTRLLSSPAIQFKGSGFYINDYAQKGKSDSGTTGGEKTEKSDKSDRSDKSDKSESKTDTKSDAAPAAASTPPSTTKS
jgi:putative FmdB family regulatory protein